MRLISVPFRVRAGAVVTVDESEDAAAAEQIAVLVRTHLGERHLVPLFGVTDPAFEGLDHNRVRLGLETFGPPVRNVVIEERFLDNEIAEAVIRFE